MAEIITVQMTKAEAWVVLNALAEANRYIPEKPARGQGLEPQMRTWVSERILREVEGFIPAAMAVATEGR